jgi:hypothetical protein
MVVPFGSAIYASRPTIAIRSRISDLAALDLDSFFAFIRGLPPQALRRGQLAIARLQLADTTRSLQARRTTWKAPRQE